MHFGPKNMHCKYTLNGVAIKETSSEKDIGVIVQANLKFDQQCKKVAQKCNQIIGQISRAFHNKDQDLMMRVY